MKECLIDTDTISYFLRNDPDVTPSARAYLALQGGFTMSVITRYEILRGLALKDAVNQLSKFEAISALSRTIIVSDAVASYAAELYNVLRRAGKTIGDADILIAATAITHDMPLVTNNTGHFSLVAGLQILNWKK